MDSNFASGRPQTFGVFGPETTPQTRSLNREAEAIVRSFER